AFLGSQNNWRSGGDDLTYLSYGVVVQARWAPGSLGRWSGCGYNAAAHQWCDGRAEQFCRWPST
ncbi:MAG: hypothetical protein V1246_09115, partial [Arenicellales bacterium]|nr:hypothetical protein [Arenicellales bacterium]